MSKEKGKKWDGKSRVSNNKYRKRFDEITWKNIDEISSIINKKDAGNPNWIKGYNKWQKEKEELNESYQQSLNNKKERQKNDE